MKQSALARFFSIGIAAFVALLAVTARGVVRELASTNDASPDGGAIGGDIVYKFTMDDGSIEYAHVFTSTNTDTYTAKFTIPANSPISRKSFRILAVGGGGAGGNDCGGGGGAGGFYEDDSYMFAPGEYTISVGAGGPSWADTSANHHGENGGDTFIKLGNTEIIRLLGGGGGGVWDSSVGRAGFAGGSGGGGSCPGSIGGASTQDSTMGYGIGYEGNGVGFAYSVDSDNVGGGGGGAGGPGVAATKTRAGNGGAGVTSDITGEEIVYAEGGGGAGSSAIALGYGGGDSTTTNGNGGDATVAGRPAAPHTGSGGGGGGRGNFRISGAGADGTVIIRYRIPVAQAYGDDVVTSDADGQTYFKYGANGTFNVLGAVKARVLAVGGGGAGGNYGETDDSYGAAAGGGAGGLVDKDLYFSAGTYNIYVGAGAPANTKGDTRGGTGMPSFIVVGGSVTNIYAYGGGGGGAAYEFDVALGAPGGSGGGGTYCEETDVEGGEAIQPSSVWGGYGNAGGTGRTPGAGAGGGGAGGAGGDATAPDQGGAGGAGYYCDITGTRVCYAAGGGGGSCDGAGGSGGDTGGAGAGVSARATAGTVNTGSGGGGGNGNYKDGGAGGSGVIIIRVLAERTAEFEKPATDLGSIPFDGSHDYCPYSDYDPDFQTVTGTIVANTVGTYTFTISLEAGLKWSDGTSDPVTCTWSITAPNLDVKRFALAGWQQGEVPSMPVVFSTPRLESSWVRYDISSNDGADWTEWTPGTTLETGNYKARLVVFANSNYTIPGSWTQLSDGSGGYVNSAATTSFSVVEYNEEIGFPDYLGYHTVFTVTIDPGEELENFPMLVRINEGDEPGVYRNTRSDHSDIRFTMPGEPDTPLAYEIDTWDESGDSLVWVKVPKYKLGTQVVMSWGELVEVDSNGVATPVSIPANPEDSVWDEYAGVWHFGEDVSAAAAAEGMVAADSSPNGNDAVPYYLPSKGDLSVMVSESGVFGNARVNGKYSGATNADYTWFKIPDFDNSAIICGAFAFSGWISITQYTGDPVIISSKTVSSDVAAGWEIKQAAGFTRTRVYTWGYGNTPSGPSQISSVALKDKGFLHLTVVYDGNTVKIYSHSVWGGDYESQVEISAATPTTGLGLGGNLGSARSLWGSFDEFRIRKAASSAAWANAEYAQAGGAYGASGLYTTPNATFLNRWLSEPSVSPTSVQDGAEIAIVEGEGVYGAGDAAWHIETFEGENLGQDLAALESGSYVVIFDLPAGGDGDSGTRGWTGLETRVTITIRRPSPTYRLGDAAEVTRFGRILLANDDANPTQPVEGQSYYLSKDNVAGDNATYWKHGQEVANRFPNLMPATVSTLKSLSPVAEFCGSSDIWHLNEVRIGNTYEYDANGVRLTPATKNFLPQPKTAKAISGPDGEDGALDESAHLVMRNVENAAIYSPCYTNGIGSIYFDAVNGWTAHEVKGNEIFRIVVEICTASSSGEIPSDENVHSVEQVIDDDGNATSEYVTNLYAKAAWVPVEMTAIKIVGGVVLSQSKTSELVLDIENGGGANSFYRIVVDKETLDIRTPVRFRIRRSGVDMDNIDHSDGDSLILVDNIEVSPPPSRVDLSPLGNYDSSKGGSQVTGWSGAFEIAFPSVASEEFRGRMEPEYYTNYLANVSGHPSSMVVSSMMHYRWRYLGQAFNPADGDGWKTTALIPSSGYRSVSPLDVPRHPGDIEFWTETVISANFYRYCDYTGLDVGVPGYSEEITVVTNRCTDTSVKTKTRGTDWFVRIRDGASEWERLGLTVIGVDGVTNTLYATLVADSTWRCYFKTLTNETGTVKFRVDGYNRQSDGDSEWVTNTVLFAIDPSSVAGGANKEGVLSGAFAAKEEFADSDWYPLEIDAKTGYLMFQLDDTSRSITVVHADYQNFNQWSTSATTGGKFVGTFSEDAKNPVAGSANNKQAFDSDFSTWSDMPAGSTYWRETFTDSTAINSTYRKEAFTTPNGWTARAGKIIYETFSEGDQRALQMKGEGEGAVEYVTSGATQPRGIDTLSFTTRLANSVGWDDISYSDVDGMTSLENYTFVAGVKGVTNATDKLPGAYSFSLVANYKPKKGCYEFRYVQKSERVGSLQLWKWAKVGASKPKAYFLGSGSWSWLASNSGLTSTDMTKWAKMSISVTNQTDGAVKVIGVLNANAPALPDEEYGGTTEAGQSVLSYAIEFIDKGDVGGEPLKKGTVGVVSANCPARFASPRFYTEALDVSAGAKGYPDAGSLVDEGFTAYGGSFLISYPSTAKGPTGALNSEIVNDGYDYDDWALSDRMVPTSVNEKAALQAVASSQTLGIFLAKAGTTSFGEDPVATVDVASFSTNNTSIALRRADDCSLQIRTIGEENSADVVIDNIEFTQWRGENWSALDRDVITKKPTYDVDTYAWTNFTFTTCWVTNHTVLMSARRTATNSLCSIVSPLMDGWEYRNGYKAGTGLGQISFAFHGAQTNACITVQAFTNATNITQGEAYSYAWEKEGGWFTITNYTFETEVEGIRSCYVGLRGVHGLLRLVVNDDLVRDLAEEEDTTAFGDIYIDSVTVYDEPDIDFRSWWGWNVRSLGDHDDTEGRMLLGDVSEKNLGQTVALNNSVTLDIVEKDYATYTRHLPFVQSPTFGTNLVGGVTFKARKYNYKSDESSEYVALNARPAFVTLYGSETGYEEGPWVWLKDFEITSTVFADFEYTTSSSVSHKAFRFVVRGVSGTEDSEDYNNAPAEGKAKWDDGFPVRVLLDEMVVTEAMRPRVGFRGVGAFRSDLNGTEPVPGVPCESEQPLCKEGWGVQCEIYKAQLPDMIDFDSAVNPPRVVLHWYVGDDNWGWENWRTNANAKSVALLRADTPASAEEPAFIYRSSYTRNADGAESVVPEVSVSGKLVQYMLEVQYNQFNDEGESFPATNYLTAADWTTPEWYRPIDYNAEKGTGFSAYTILDAVAPRWAWINEVNILGEIGSDGYSNTDSNCQYVEIAAPADADLTGWYVQMLAIDGVNVVTNVAAVFGRTGDIPGTKDLKFANAANGMIFHVLGSPASEEARGGLLKYSDGTLDGVWSFDGRTTVYRTGDISPFYPIAVQLVRPRGILESEIVAAGTNYFAQFDSEYAEQFYPENTYKNLNRLIDGAQFIYIGTDDNWTNGVITNSLSVVTNVGGSSACWTNDTYSCWTNGVGRTPGRANIGQAIEGTPPSPGGMSRIIFSSLVGKRIWQWDTELGDWTTNDVALYVRRNVETNMLFKVANWNVMGDVVWQATASNTPCIAKAVLTEKPNEWYVPIGTNVEGNIIVNAHSEPNETLDGLVGEDNRYREAVLEWLAGGKNLFGDAWEEGDGNLYLAEFRTLADVKQADLTLTQMYLLDIPPTVSNMWLKGGLWKFQYPYLRNDYHYAGEELKNYLMGIELYVTNANPASAYTVNGRRDWSPYVIQGVEPGNTSWDWTSYGGYWVSSTFNLQAKKLNDLTKSDPDKYWVKLNRFVFDYDSFDENHRSLIEIEDVTSPFSPAYFEFVALDGDFVGETEEGDDPEAPFSLPNPLFRWNIGDDLGTDQIKVLAPNNLID